MSIQSRIEDLRDEEATEPNDIDQCRVCARGNQEMVGKEMADMQQGVQVPGGAPGGAGAVACA
eukprot:4373688-Pyramimonas_sp.AAC.1